MHPRRSALLSLTFLAFIALPARAAAPRGVAVDERLRDGQAAVVVESARHGEPQRYLVTFEEPPAHPMKPGSAAFASRVGARQALARRFADELARPGTRLLRSYDRLIAGAAVLAPARSEAMLRALPGVRAVFPDAEVTAMAGEHLAQVRADRVQQELGGTGLGVRVGIIDSGVDYTHPALGGGFGPGFRVAGGWDFVNGDADPRDDEGHGTHVAGIVAGNGGGVLGVAPAATLYAYKVLRADGGGFLSDVISALEACADPDADPNTDDALDVVNLSLGSRIPYDNDPTSQAVDALDALGTVVVVAAGNFGFPFGVATPAIARGAITVGSVDANDSLATTSSRGPTLGLRLKPDLVAPGEGIESSAPGGGVATRSGTSMAAPVVAGTAALLRQLHPDWTREELRSALVSHSKDLQRPAAQQGSGRLDAYAAATARLFVAPTSLAFGQVANSEANWVRTRTLRIHTRGPGIVSLSLASLRLPPWLEASLSATNLVLQLGDSAVVTLTLRSKAAHAPLPDPPYVAEGTVVVEGSGETCRVPFSIHEALHVQMISYGGASPGLLFGQGRAWPAVSPGTATWLLQPGLYDALTYNQDALTYELEPTIGITDIAIAADTVIAAVRSTATSDLTFALRTERGTPLIPKTLAVQWSPDAGGALAFLDLRTPARLTFPVMKSGYRLDWWAYDPDGLNRYDIPGVERAPLSNHIVGNDPSALRRVVEHVHVPAGDSLLLSDVLQFSEGYRFAYEDRFAVPYGQSVDIVRWGAPNPVPRHMRFGRRTWSLDPAKARADDPAAANGRTPLWDRTHADTLLPWASFGTGAPFASFTGREVTFGSGPAFPSASFHAQDGAVEAVAFDREMPWLFRDGAGSNPSGPPIRFGIVRGSITLLGTVDPDVLRSTGRWSEPIPDGPLDLILTSDGWTVAGRPSVTTVRISFDERRTSPSPEWFSIVAGGSPAERIVFGQDRDPHVELRSAVFFDRFRDTPLAIEVRAGGSGAWTPLGLERHGSSVRATIPPMVGDISLRVRMGGSTPPEDYAPMTVEIFPAFVGELSAAANAPVVEARADADGAHVAWRVPAPGASLIVERIEPSGAWKEYDELVVDPDGLARFDDPAVIAGGRYGYRLGGSEAAFVEIPGAQAGLALAIRPNPVTAGLFASVTLDRDAPVTIRVHDLLGRVVASRTWSGLGPGLHVLPVAARGKLQAGLYFVRLEREGETRVRRVTVLE